jgi:hypothetical protein
LADSSFILPDADAPTWVYAGAVATAGSFPRALELVQFLSIYCTSLSSEQQHQVRQFQVASLTRFVMSKSTMCGICPGSCLQPVVLVFPTFVLVTSLTVVGAIVAGYDVYKMRKAGSLGEDIRSRLLDSTAATGAATPRSSLLHSFIAFCVWSFRNVIEGCSSYVLMPCTFVFVVNIRPSSFAHAESSDRFMIVMLPVISLLFRALVIHQRIVKLTSADQKQLAAGSICSCLVAAVLSVYFDQGSEARQSNASFSSDTLPQYIVLVLLVVQIIIQTTIRERSSEASMYDSMNWSPTASRGSSAIFPFQELEARLLMGSVKRASFAGATAAVKFIVFNYLAISQAVMVVVGISSAGYTSLLSVRISSVIIGSIPLVTSSILLVYNTAKITLLLRQKCFGMKKAEHRSSQMECRSESLVSSSNPRSIHQPQFSL